MVQKVFFFVLHHWKGKTKHRIWWYHSTPINITKLSTYHRPAGAEVSVCWSSASQRTSLLRPTYQRRLLSTASHLYHSGKWSCETGGCRSPSACRRRRRVSWFRSPGGSASQYSPGKEDNCWVSVVISCTEVKQIWLLTYSNSMDCQTEVTSQGGASHSLINIAFLTFLMEIATKLYT